MHADCSDLDVIIVYRVRVGRSWRIDHLGGQALRTSASRVVDIKALTI